MRAQGSKIATSYWGKAWCDNLESYSDFENRLPRGRTYLRNGSVLHLEVRPGRIAALVSGSEIYEIAIEVSALSGAKWKNLVAECSGKIQSIVDLLRGTFSRGVMQVLARRGNGLFPEPREVRFSCSCPDWALMCKHVAAVLYGVGTRFDSDPALFFLLRQVESSDLVAAAASAEGLQVAEPPGALADSDLGALFGIELEGTGPVAPPQPKRRGRKKDTPARSTDFAVEGDGFEEVFGPDLETSPSLLVGFGVPASVYQKWLRSGVLARTGERGVYRTTARTLAAFRALQSMGS